MPIQMTDFKMIYKDQVFNVLQINPILDGNTATGKSGLYHYVKPELIDTSYIGI